MRFEEKKIYLPLTTYIYDIFLRIFLWYENLPKRIKSHRFSSKFTTTTERRLRRLGCVFRRIHDKNLHILRHLSNFDGWCLKSEEDHSWLWLTIRKGFKFYRWTSDMDLNDRKRSDLLLVMALDRIAWKRLTIGANLTCNGEGNWYNK